MITATVTAKTYFPPLSERDAARLDTLKAAKAKLEPLTDARARRRNGASQRLAEARKKMEILRKTLDLILKTGDKRQIAALAKQVGQIAKEIGSALKDFSPDVSGAKADVAAADAARERAELTGQPPPEQSDQEKSARATVDAGAGLANEARDMIKGLAEIIKKIKAAIPTHKRDRDIEKALSAADHEMAEAAQATVGLQAEPAPSRGFSVVA